MQVFGLITSMVTLATVLVSFQKSLRLSLPTKAKLSFMGMVGQFLWRVCTIATRVLALALFASYFHYYVFVVVAVHWMVMMLWVIKQETMFCVLRDRDGQRHHSRGLEFCFRFLAAFIHIFCFFNLIEGHTRLRCVVYYGVMYVENLSLVMTWYIIASTNREVSWYFMPGLVCVLVIFWVGIGFQVLYYMCCHPNNMSVLHVRKRIRWWVSCPQLSLTKDVEEIERRRAYDAEDAHQEAGVGTQQLMTPSQAGGPPPFRKHGPVAANVRRVPSNSSSNSSMPRPPPRLYTPQVSSQKQAYRPQQPTPQGGGAATEALLSHPTVGQQHPADPLQTAV